jgi:hypothetical protein
VITCSTISVAIITSNIPVLPETNFGAVLVGNKAGRYRLYAQSKNGDLIEMNGDDTDKKAWTTRVVADSVRKGSAITVSTGSKVALNVYYINADKKLSFVGYNGGWVTRKSFLVSRNLRQAN